MFPQTKANLEKFKLKSSAQFSLSCVQLISTFIQLLAFKRLTVFSGFLPRAECTAWQDYQNTAGDEQLNDRNGSIINAVNKITLWFEFYIFKSNRTKVLVLDTRIHLEFMNENCRYHNRIKLLFIFQPPPQFFLYSSLW